MMNETSDLDEKMDPPPEKMIVDENTKEDQSKESLARNKGTQRENNVIRIVNLGDRFIEATLRDFIQEQVQPNGKVQELYIRKNDKYQIFYAYIIFELGCDAVKATQILNGYKYNTYQFDVALIGPHLPLKKYASVLYNIRAKQLTEQHHRRMTDRMRPRINLKLWQRLSTVTTEAVGRTINTAVQNESVNH